MNKLLLVATPLLAACSATPPQQHPEPPPPGTGPDYFCREEGLSGFVGQQASAEVGAQILQQSGARTLRWIPHDGVITMELRPDRVNVRLDRSSRIDSVSCG